MAFYNFYPSKDATIYENNPLLNTGLDSILELEKDGIKKSRIVMDFDIDEIQTIINQYNISSDRKFYLKLFIGESKEIPLQYTIYIYPLSQSFEMGIGKKDIEPINTDGVNWEYSKTNEYWNATPLLITGSYSNLFKQLNTTASYIGDFNGYFTGYFTGEIYATTSYTDIYNITVYYTASTAISNSYYDGKIIGSLSGSFIGNITALLNGTINASLIQYNGGGNYISSSLYECTQSFDYEAADLNIDISKIIEAWISNSIDKDGLIIKFSDILENQNNESLLQYFSRDTHTVYPPRLIMLYNDATFITASLPTSQSITDTKFHYISSKTPINNFTPFYPTFEIPHLNQNVTYSYSESFVINDVKEISDSKTYYNFYVYNNPFYGHYIGRLTGNYNDIFTGSISGTFSNISEYTIDTNIYLIGYNRLYTESINLDAYLFTLASGSFIGNFKPVTIIRPIDPIGYINGYLSASYIGSFDYFSGSYSGSINQVSMSGIGILTSSINVNAILDGNINGLVTCSLNGYFSGTYNGNVGEAFSGSFDGLLNTDISGSFSGNINIPINGYIQSLQLNMSGTFSDTYIDAQVLGNFNGYAKGYMYESIQLFNYYITGSRDYIYTTQTILKPLNEPNFIIYIQEPLFHYSENTNNLIRVIGRERYPQRTYFERSTYLDIKYLPSSSYYAIYDNHNDDVIIDFDDIYTKLSCDENGNYFIFNTFGLQPERLYRFIFKIIKNNMIEIFDNNYIFKISR